MNKNFIHTEENEIDVDTENAKYELAEGMRAFGHEPFAIPGGMAGVAGISVEPVNDIDQYFADINKEIKAVKSVGKEAARVAVAFPRQVVQEPTDALIDFVGERVKDFYIMNGFGKAMGMSDKSEEKYVNNMYSSLKTYMAEKGIDTDLPLKSFQPETGIGTAAREIGAYFTGFLLGRPQFTKVQGVGESVFDTVSDWGYRLMSNVRANSMGAMALNVRDANLSQLAVELGFEKELMDYFEQGSAPDVAAEAVAGEIATRANQELEPGDELTAEMRLMRKVDTVLEDNAVGGILSAAVMTAAKVIKPIIYGGAGAAATVPSEAESAPFRTVTGELANEMIKAERKNQVLGDPLRKFRDDQDVTIDENPGGIDTAPIERMADADELGFYSQAARVIDGLTQTKMTGQQAKRMLEKNGVKPEEMQWTGLNDFLANKESVTKDELAQHISDNAVEVKEIELPAMDEDARGDSEDVFNEAMEDVERNLDEQNMTVDDDPSYWEDTFEMFTDEFENEGSNYIMFDDLMAELGRTGRYDEDDIVKIKAGIENATLEGESIGDYVASVAPEYRLLKADITDFFDEQARASYMDDPYYYHGFSVGSARYEISGSNEIGWTVNREGETVIDSVYSLNEVNVRLRDEIMEYGDIDYPYDSDYPAPGYAQHEQFTEDGGENYRELLMKNDNYQGDPAINDPDMKAPDRRLLSGFSAPEHFDEENLIYHVRVKDRKAADGGKVLYIEELQSDWAQRGRDRGFFNPDAREPDVVKAELVDIERQKSLILQKLISEGRLDDAAAYARRGYNELIDNSTATTMNYDAAQMSKPYANLMRKEKALNKELNIGRSLPRGPFVQKTDKWSGLAVKRLMRYALENGYDYIALTPGQVQRDRWNNRGLQVFYDEILPQHFSKELKKIKLPQGELFSNQSIDIGKIEVDELGERIAIKLNDDVRQSVGGGTPLFTPIAVGTGGAAAMMQQNNQQPAM